MFYVEKRTTAQKPHATMPTPGNASAIRVVRSSSEAGVVCFRILSSRGNLHRIYRKRTDRKDTTNISHQA